MRFCRISDVIIMKKKTDAVDMRVLDRGIGPSLVSGPHINGVSLFLHYGDIADSTTSLNYLSHSTG